SFTDSLVEIKWPNDILIEGNKVCGVLTETVWSGDSPVGIILGIGINITEASLEIDEPLRFPATYLQRYTDSAVSQAEVLRHLIQQLILNHDPRKWPEIHTTWNQVLAFKGQQIRAIRQEGEEISGKLLGVALSGELEIELADSATVLYNANEIQRITPTADIPKEQHGTE
ncbi:MAG: biotin--[acetyl-CoA-carboxylase] ligase, partial [Anaerolineales bacterium]